MIDEISSDKRYTSQEVSRQEQLIAKYFDNIEGKISTAVSHEQAQAIVDDVIDAFQNDCQSEILPEFLKMHLLKLIEKYWRNEKE